MASLWGEDFAVPSTAEVAKQVRSKIKNKKEVKVSTEKAIKSKTVSVVDKLSLITAEVYRILGKYAEQTVVIKTKEQLTEYIDKAIENGIISIDTETNNSLDPITCKLMGPCIYTPGMLNAYIPINHVDLNGNRLDWQLTENDVEEQFNRVKGLTVIMHNGKFDYQVLKCTCNLITPVTWDTMIGARILNENEMANLKDQYRFKIDPSQEKYDIEHLFKDIEYAIVNPDVFALYAATDAYMTYKLYEYQKEQFSKPENKRIYDLFLNVEMPVVHVAAEMELTGVNIDKVYSDILSKKYHEQLDIIQAKIDKELDKYQDKLTQWRLSESANIKPPVIDKSTKKQKIDPKTGNLVFGKSKNEQLEYQINMGSPVQLAILLYDVLDVGVIDPKQPRGTGEDILTRIDLPICKLILEKRGVGKLINTYIDKLPECVNSKTGRLHAHFNQIGTDTGRFSSSEPNLQNIPSHNKEIRMMFKATEGYSLVGADFSQQEPRLLGAISGDDGIKNAYKQGKDLYATMGVGAYHNKYEDNLEHYPDGSIYPEGKKRRSAMKVLLLGISYGMGVSSIAEDLNCSIEEAQKILNNFYGGFPKVKVWQDSVKEKARITGYVEDYWGRRRHLPDLNLPKYEYKLKKEKQNSDFNPLLGAKGLYVKEESKLIVKYRDLMSKARMRRDIESVKRQAAQEGVTIIDHGMHISNAERQAINAPIQGSAATMSKIALVKVFENEELNKLGFRLLLQIHDEFIGECPKENAEKASELLSTIMKTSIAKYTDVPFKCDASITSRWYEDEYLAILNEYYHEQLKLGLTKDQIIDKIKLEKPEATVFDLSTVLE